jgi:hypothetical protein
MDQQTGGRPQRSPVADTPPVAPRPTTDAPPSPIRTVDDGARLLHLMRAFITDPVTRF